VALAAPKLKDVIWLQFVELLLFENLIPPVKSFVENLRKVVVAPSPKTHLRSQEGGGKTCFASCDKHALVVLLLHSWPGTLNCGSNERHERGLAFPWV